MSPERLEMLIQQDSNSKVININKISLIYGDEVSRVRISRLVQFYLKQQSIIVCTHSHKLYLLIFYSNIAA